MKNKLLTSALTLALLGCTTSAFSMVAAPSAQELTHSLPPKIASSQWEKELSVALEAARRAGKEILALKQSKGDLQVKEKQDQRYGAIVSAADLKAHEIISQALVAQFPSYGLLSQESIDNPTLLNEKEWREREMAWIIDPLDGVEAFIKNGTDYGVHIGLTQNGVPVLGVNYYPETDTAYYAIRGCGAYKQVGHESPQALSVPSTEGKILPIRNKTPSETAAIYEKLLQRKITPELLKESFPVLDSCGWRLVSITEGSRNLYITAGIKGGLWDFCSGEVILTEAGGFISDLNGNPIDYRSADGKLKAGAVVSGDKALYEKVLTIQRA